MTLARKSTQWALAAALTLGMAMSAFAQIPSTTSDADPATRDGLRTGGCTGCFDAQTQAAIATFSSVKRVFRICQTGGGITATQSCDGSGHGVLAQFIEIQGDLRNSSTDALGLGVPGGATNVTVRISGNGSTRPPDSFLVSSMKRCSSSSALEHAASPAAASHAMPMLIMSRCRIELFMRYDNLQVPAGAAGRRLVLSALRFSASTAAISSSSR